jgi:hypothetical protein
MKTSEIAEQMCRSELAAADIKAICNSRGFSLSNTGSPALLESLILSDVGLQSAFSSLDRKEIIMLHFLKCWNKPVDITVFERLTGKRSNWYGSFNQRYGDLFKRIKLNMIRKGLLVFSTDASLIFKKTKLERQVFGFPTQFHADLPPPFSSSAVLPGHGEHNAPFIRAKLNQLLQPVPRDETDPFAWSVNAGVLMMGEGEFETDTFRKWQHRQWAMSCSPSLLDEDRSNARLSPLAALDYAFSTLGSDEWIEPVELEPIFRIFCREKTKLDARQIFRQGWEKACLVRQEKDGKRWYRPAPPFQDISGKPRYGDYLHVDDAGGINVNLETIPLNCLEAVSRISRFRIENGVLTAAPDIIRMGRMINEIREASLTKWLTETSTAFSQAFSTVAERWGRQLVHRNLLIAKVKNIGLKVSLEKTFKDGKIIFLPGDFIAFPESVRSQVETLVTQNGFAVKTIDQSS